MAVVEFGKKKKTQAKVAQSELPDKIKELGFRADKLASGWVGSEIQGDRRFGPAKTQAELYELIVAGIAPATEGNGKAEQVQEDTDFEVLTDAAIVESSLEEEGFEKVETDVKGQQFIPGTEPYRPPIVQSIIDQVKEIEATLKPAFTAASRALVSAQDKLSDLSHEHIKFFTPPDEKGKRVYRAGGVKVTITFEKEKISTELEDEDPKK